MEHVFNIAINVEDEKIVNTIMESGVKQIEKDIQQSIMDKLFETGWRNAHSTTRDPLSQFSKNIVESFLEAHKDEIIDSAGKYISEYLKRTKAVKELVGGEG